MKTEQTEFRYFGKDLPVFVDRFSSPVDMITGLRKRPLHVTYNAYSDYFAEEPIRCYGRIAGEFYRDSEAIMKAFRHGAVDKELRSTLRSARLKPLTASEEATLASQRVYKHYGSCPKVGRMLSGDMRCMVNYTRPPEEHNAVNLGINLTMATSNMEYRPTVGRAIARAVISLERLGYHVGITIGSSVVTRDEKRVMAMTCTLKKPDEDFNIGKVMFPLTEQAYQNILYGWVVRHPKANNRKSDKGKLGFVLDSSCGDMDTYNDTLFGEDTIHLSYPDLTYMLRSGKYDEDGLFNYIKALIME